MKDIAAIVLAAGRGTRLNSRTVNKVMLPIGGKPMIGHTVNVLKKSGIDTVVIVVGFAKQSIIDYLGDSVLYAEQRKQLGTAHAAECGLKILPAKISDVVIVYGDDSYCYPPKLLQKMIALHKNKKADVTLLTVEKDNPRGLGRILRDTNDKVVGIVEEKNATAKQKEIKEINTGCYVFDRKFLEEYLPRVKKNKVSGEYYLPDLVELAVKNKKRLEAIRGSNIPWRGVNTRGELTQARRIMTMIQ